MVVARATFRSARSVASGGGSSVVVPDTSMVEASATDGVAVLKEIFRGAMPVPETRVMTWPRSRGSTSSTSVAPASPSDSWAMLVEK